MRVYAKQKEKIERMNINVFRVSRIIDVAEANPDYEMKHSQILYTRYIKEREKRMQDREFKDEEDDDDDDEEAKAAFEIYKFKAEDY